MEKQLTIIYAYYDNPKMFVLQQQKWAQYSFELKEKIRFIVVDDCSPRWACKKDPMWGTQIKILRMSVDIPWNMDACRNLAVSQTDTKWLFLSDMDHILPAESIQRIFSSLKTLDVKKFYTFMRLNAPDYTSYKPHPNTYLMTKSLYEKVGGYDESFAGFYGTDGHFRRALRFHSKGDSRLPIPIIRYPREIVSDASTTTLDRKKGRDREKGKEYQQVAKYNLDNGIRPKTLTFPWDRTC